MTRFNLNSNLSRSFAWVTILLFAFGCSSQKITNKRNTTEASIGKTSDAVAKPGSNQPKTEPNPEPIIVESSEFVADNTEGNEGEIEVLKSGIPDPVLPPKSGLDDEIGKEDKGIQISSNPNAEIRALGLVQQKGSEKRFLNALALTRIYSRVFSKKDGKWAYNCNIFDRGNCDDNLFTRAESNSLGLFDFDRLTTSIKPVKDLKLDYLRSVRSGLSRECRNLVMSEWADIKPENKLVKEQTKITAQTIEIFMRTLLAIPDGISFDFPSASYEAAFNETLADKKLPDDLDEVRNGYINLCVLLSSDPLVTMY